MHVDARWGRAKVSYAKSTRLLSIEFDVRARKRQFEKKNKKRGGTEGASNARHRSEAKPVLVCAIRIPSITDNLDRSRPFSHPQTECFAF